MSIFKRDRDEEKTSGAEVPVSPDETLPAAEAEPEDDATTDPLIGKVAGYSWRILVILALGWVVLWLLVRLRIVVMPVIVALFLTSVLSPVALWLKKHGWHPLLATWAAMIAMFAVVVGLVMLIAPSVGDELGQVGKRVEEGFQQVLDYLARSPLDISEQDVDRYVQQATDALSANRDKITSGVLTGAMKAVELVTQFFLTLVLTFFFVKDGPELFGWIERQFPRRNRRHVRAAGERAWAVMAAYLRGIGITGLVDAILIGVVLLVLGVPLVLPLALLTFFGAFFPLVGAVAAGTIATLVALVTTGAGDALVVAGATLVIQQVEGDVLQPIVMGRTVNLHPVVILLALTAGGILAGIVGAFLAVPVAAISAALGNYMKQVRAGTA